MEAGVRAQYQTARLSFFEAQITAENREDVPDGKGVALGVETARAPAS
jgi:hypothetical protein